MYVCGCQGQRSKKHFLQKHQNLDFASKEGPMVDDRVLPGSKEHQLPGSKVKKTFFTKTSKSRFHAERRSNGGRLCPSGVKRTSTSGFKGQKNIFYKNIKIDQSDEGTLKIDQSDERSIKLTNQVEGCQKLVNRLEYPSKLVCRI